MIGWAVKIAEDLRETIQVVAESTIMSLQALWKTI